MWEELLDLEWNLWHSCSCWEKAETVTRIQGVSCLQWKALQIQRAWNPTSTTTVRFINRSLSLGAPASTLQRCFIQAASVCEGRPAHFTRHVYFYITRLIVHSSDHCVVSQHFTYYTVLWDSLWSNTALRSKPRQTRVSLCLMSRVIQRATNWTSSLSELFTHKPTHLNPSLSLQTETRPAHKSFCLSCGPEK